jgi:hypothetical protein
VSKNGIDVAKRNHATHSAPSSEFPSMDTEETVRRTNDFKLF